MTSCEGLSRTKSPLRSKKVYTNANGLIQGIYTAIVFLGITCTPPRRPPEARAMVSQKNLAHNLGALSSARHVILQWQIQMQLSPNGSKCEDGILGMLTVYV